MEHISEILTTALSRYRLAQDTSMTQIWDIWEEALEKEIAANAKPDAFKDGILMVNVSSSAWMHQLRFLEAGIVQNINKKLGRPMIKQIRFKIGKILG
jgi:predicted nucleic acid-binding Zn ribbon protein